MTHGSLIVKAPYASGSLIVSSVLIGLVVLGFILFAVFQSGRGISDARMKGVVVAKEFTPQPERRSRSAGRAEPAARDKEGIFLLSVEVPQNDGTKKTYTVELMEEGSV